MNWNRTADYDEGFVYLHVSKDVFSLRSEIILHESLLTTTVPQVQGQVAEEPDVRVLHVDGGAQPSRVAGDVVGEDDGPHRGLARPRLSHQQDLLLHGLAN